MRRFRGHTPRWVAGLGVAAGLTAACSGTSPPEAGLPVPVGSYARVRVIVTRQAERAAVLLSSRFVGFRGVDRATADLLTGGDAPLAQGCAAAPAIAPYEDLLALLPDSGQGRIEHLDAGDVTALVDGAALTSTPTARPALAPYVAGMEYEDGAAAIALPHGEVRVASRGGARVGAFEADATLPPPIEAHATWGSDLTVTWEPSAADDVVLTIAPERGASAVVCHALDRGELRVRADLLQRIAGVAPGGPVTVVIDRMRSAGFSATGLADAALEVVARDVITATAP